MIQIKHPPSHTPYWMVRRVLRWLCRIFAQQCSGKRRNGYAVEWCQYNAFHDGPCLAWDKTEFTGKEQTPDDLIRKIHAEHDSY